MPDTIDARDRALIAGAVAEGRVTLIPGRDPREVAIAARRHQVKEMHGDGVTAEVMAERLGVSAGTIANDKRAMQLVRIYQDRNDIVSQTKAKLALKGAKKVHDRRRFTVVPVPMGSPSIMAPEGATRTLHPSRCFVPDMSELVLKDGCNNSKIGGDVLVGRLKGAYIATLTLEERATCPTDCKMWRGCYGNSMHYARRFAAGKPLEKQIKQEVKLMCGKHDQVLIRLHVLGDFYSFDYLCLWAGLLDEYDNLNIFGFTAWQPNTKIGAGVVKLRRVYPFRFAVRTSGMTGQWGSFTLPFPTQAKTIGDAIVCPEQLDGMMGSPEGKHCGNCAVCWSTDRAVAFVEH